MDTDRPSRTVSGLAMKRTRSASRRRRHAPESRPVRRSPHAVCLSHALCGVASRALSLSLSRATRKHSCSDTGTKKEKSGKRAKASERERTRTPRDNRLSCPFSLSLSLSRALSCLSLRDIASESESTQFARAMIYCPACFARA